MNNVETALATSIAGIASIADWLFVRRDDHDLDLPKSRDADLDLDLF